jgi:hypothetical protein
MINELAPTFTLFNNRVLALKPQCINDFHKILKDDFERLTKENRTRYKVTTKQVIRLQRLVGFTVHFTDIWDGKTIKLPLQKGEYFHFAKCVKINQLAEVTRLQKEVESLKKELEFYKHLTVK